MAVTWALLSRKAVSGEKKATLVMKPNMETFSFPVQPWEKLREGEREKVQMTLGESCHCEEKGNRA